MVTTTVQHDRDGALVVVATPHALQRLHVRQAMQRTPMADTFVEIMKTCTCDDTGPAWREGGHGGTRYAYNDSVCFPLVAGGSGQWLAVSCLTRT